LPDHAEALKKLAEIIEYPAVALRTHIDFIGNHPAVQGEGRETFTAETGLAFLAAHQLPGISSAFNTDILAFFTHNFTPMPELSGYLESIPARHRESSPVDTANNHDKV